MAYRLASEAGDAVGQSERVALRIQHDAQADDP
jgi:hypothetical protein